jgi:DNA-binding response OmpR family regulator
MREKKQKAITVLVIDDDDRVRTLITDIIRFAGHRAVEARDGHSGMRYLEEGGFDIVLTDLGMPGTNGWEVARYAKQKTPQTPVILITGWGLEVDESKIRESGVDLVIGKPFQIQDVISAVNRFVSTRQSGPTNYQISEWQ